MAQQQPQWHLDDSYGDSNRSYLVLEHKPHAHTRIHRAGTCTTLSRTHFAHTHTDRRRRLIGDRNETAKESYGLTQILLYAFVDRVLVFIIRIIILLLFFFFISSTEMHVHMVYNNICA